MHQNGFVHLTRSFGHGISRRAVLNRFAGAGALAALAAVKGPHPRVCAVRIGACRNR